MATDYEVRVALADTLDAVDGLRTHAFTPGQVNPPAAVVISVDVQFDLAMQRGSERMLAVVRLLTGGEMRSAQITLSQLIYTCRDVLWDNASLGGVVQDARLARKRGESEGQIDVAGSTYAVVDYEVEVIT